MSARHPGSRASPATAPIERASSIDLMELATGGGPATGQIGAILLLDASVELAAVRRALDARIRSVPRLRQRLARTPFGCGAPIWVDDRGFRLDEHVREARCPDPGNEQALLAVAGDLVVRRLPTTRPLWSATLVTGIADGRSALVLVLHHVLADGIGGLAILARLVDGAPGSTGAAFPRPAPSRGRLLADAVANRLRRLADAPAAVRRLPGALAELLPGRSVHAPRCSLNRPIGPHRRFAVVRTELASVRAAAHAHGGTVNDAALAAVAGALRVLLRSRGEDLAHAVISVPVSARRSAAADRLGNQIGVMPVDVPTGGPPGARLAAIAAVTRARKRAPRASSAAVVAPVVRALHRLGLLNRFINRQHLVTTFLTNVRGPEVPVSFLGCTVLAVVPLSETNGNVTVAFAVFSYAGSFTITIVADPDTCPDLPVLTDALQGELDALAAEAARRPVDPERAS